VRYVSRLMSDLVNDWYDVRSEISQPALG
jgi:hypothetical protein